MDFCVCPLLVFLFPYLSLESVLLNCVIWSGDVANVWNDPMSVTACLVFVNRCDLCSVRVMARSRNIRPASLVASRLFDIQR